MHMRLEPPNNSTPPPNSRFSERSTQCQAAHHSQFAASACSISSNDHANAISKALRKPADTRLAAQCFLMGNVTANRRRVSFACTKTMKQALETKLSDSWAAYMRPIDENRTSYGEGNVQRLIPIPIHPSLSELSTYLPRIWSVKAAMSYSVELPRSVLRSQRFQPSSPPVLPLAASWRTPSGTPIFAQPSEPCPHYTLTPLHHPL